MNPPPPRLRWEKVSDYVRLEGMHVGQCLFWYSGDWSRCHGQASFQLWAPVLDLCPGCPWDFRWAIIRLQISITHGCLGIRSRRTRPLLVFSPSQTHTLSQHGESVPSSCLHPQSGADIHLSPPTLSAPPTRPRATTAPAPTALAVSRPRTSPAQADAALPPAAAAARTCRQILYTQLC